MKRLIKFLILMLMFFFFLSIKISDVDAEPEKSYVNYTVCIDPGHGGYDGGAIGNGIVEKEINISLSLHLRNYLEQVGINVIMTRETDIDFVTPGKGTKKKRDLEKRIDIINNANADLFVSIHMNSLPNPRWHGAQTFYFDNLEENKILAKNIQKSIKEILQNTNRTEKTIKTLYLFKKVNVPGALIEAGFISNPYEANLLKQGEYQDKLAFAIYLGIIRYLSEEKNFY